MILVTSWFDKVKAWKLPYYYTILWCPTHGRPQGSPSIPHLPSSLPIFGVRNCVADRGASAGYDTCTEMGNW